MYMYTIDIPVCLHAFFVLHSTVQRPHTKIESQVANALLHTDFALVQTSVLGWGAGFMIPLTVSPLTREHRPERPPKPKNLLIKFTRTSHQSRGV